MYTTILFGFALIFFFLGFIIKILTKKKGKLSEEGYKIHIRKYDTNSNLSNLWEGYSPSLYLPKIGETYVLKNYKRGFLSTKVKNVIHNHMDKPLVVLEIQEKNTNDYEIDTSNYEKLETFLRSVNFMEMYIGS